MYLLWTDLVIVIGFTVFFWTTAGKDGFFAIILPYIFFGWLMVRIPIVLAVVNTFVSLYTKEYFLLGLLPLLLPIIVITVRLTQENGFKPKSISVNPWLKRIRVQYGKGVA